MVDWLYSESVTNKPPNLTLSVIKILFVLKDLEVGLGWPNVGRLQTSLCQNQRG
jgi:hypothetical protein